MALVKTRPQLNVTLPLPDPVRPRYPPSTTGATSFTSSGTVVSPADLERLEVLGHGNGGTVYKVRHRQTSALYALKVVQADSSSSVRRQVFRELEILRRTDSQHIVRCYGTFERQGGDTCILMEYMDVGTLADPLLNLSLSSVAKQVLSGLSYLHSHKIVHRDIKPSNLLVNSKREVKIADFGVSRIMSRSLDSCSSYVGTCAYMSPERFDPDSHGLTYDGYAGDIWSLGLTLMEIYVGHFPFLTPGQRPDWATLMCAICFGDPPTLPEGSCEKFRSFIGCCLQKDSSKRWTASQLLSHPFVADEP